MSATEYADLADDPSATARGRVRSLPALLIALAVLFAVVGVVFLVVPDRSGTTSSDNLAVVDHEATTEVIGQVSTALNRVLSYSYADAAATRAAARTLLTGDAAGQYQTLFTALQQKAPGEKLVLSAKVVAAGVTSLSADHARLLVFVDQSSRREGQTQTTSSAAQLQVGAVRVGGSWRVNELTPL